MTTTERVLQIKEAINGLDEVINCLASKGLDITFSPVIATQKDALLMGLTCAQELEKIEYGKK